MIEIHFTIPSRWKGEEAICEEFCVTIGDLLRDPNPDYLFSIYSVNEMGLNTNYAKSEDGVNWRFECYEHYEPIETAAIKALIKAFDQLTVEFNIDKAEERVGR